MITGLGATDPDDIMAMRPDPTPATRGRLAVIAEMPEVFGGLGLAGIAGVLAIWWLWPKHGRRPARRRPARRRRARRRWHR